GLDGAARRRSAEFDAGHRARDGASRALPVLGAARHPGRGGVLSHARRRRRHAQARGGRGPNRSREAAAARFRPRITEGAHMKTATFAALTLAALLGSAAAQTPQAPVPVGTSGATAGTTESASATPAATDYRLAA